MKSVATVINSYMNDKVCFLVKEQIWFPEEEKFMSALLLSSIREHTTDYFYNNLEREIFWEIMRRIESETLNS